MKRTTIILCLLFSYLSVFGQLFKADIRNTGPTLEVYLSVFGAGDITTGFSQIEFFIRTPTATPGFTVGTVTVNSTDFPGNIPLGLTSDNTGGGYRTLHFGYSPTNSGSSATYTNGTEYLLATIPLTGSAGGQGNFELVHDNATFASYLNVTSDIGTDLSYATCVAFLSCPGEHVFYGNTSQMGEIYTTQVANVALPVELLHFRVRSRDQEIHLDWTSVTESNFDGYELQRSDDGRDFQPIAWIVGTGGALETDYTYLDRSVVANQIYYYRLKMLDLDGRFEFSVIRSATIAATGANFSIYPNPVAKTGNITINNEGSDEMEFLLFLPDGKLINTSLIPPKSRLTLPLAGLNAGCVLYRIRSAGEVKSGKIIVQ